MNETKEYLTFSRDCGFNIVNAIDEQEAEITQDTICLNKVTEINKEIIEAVKKLIEQEPEPKPQKEDKFAWIIGKC